MNKWKYRSIKIACAFVMALSILPGATYLLACEEEEQPIEPPIEEPSCPTPEEPCEPPVVEEPIEEPEEPVIEEPPVVETPVEEEPIEEPPIEEPPVEEEPVEETPVEEPVEQPPVQEEPVVEEKPNNDNIINNNNNENNINIDIDIQQQQQQQQKQEQQLKKDNPTAYLKHKSKQVTTKKTIVTKQAQNTTKQTQSNVKQPQTQSNAYVSAEDYANGKGVIDEDYVENPETGEEEIIIGCGATIIGASVLLVIIRKFLIKI